MSEPTSTAEVRLLPGSHERVVVGAVNQVDVLENGTLMLLGPPDEGEDRGPLLYMAAPGTWLDVRTIEDDEPEAEPDDEAEDLSGVDTADSTLPRIGRIDDLSAEQIKEIKEAYAASKEGRQRCPRGWVRTTAEKYGVSVLTIARMVGQSNA